MTTPPDPNHWRRVLEEQGRDMTWLAKQTGAKRRTVYAYGSGQIKKPPTDWLELVSTLLGVTVTG